MNFALMPSVVGGTLIAPKSSVEAHLFLAMSALADKPTRTEDYEFGSEVEATVGCVKELGALVRRKNGFLEVSPYLSDLPATMQCGNSEKTLHYMLPITAARGLTAKYIVGEYLAKMPIMPVYKTLFEHGHLMSSPRFPMYCGQKIHSGAYELSSVHPVSFAAGLLLALPLLEGNSTLSVPSKAGTADVLKLLSLYGIEIETHGTTFYIRGGQKYTSPGVVFLENDFVATSFWLFAGALSPNGVTVKDFTLSKTNKGKKLLATLAAAGAKITQSDKNITVVCENLNAFELDATELSEILPFLAVFASVCKGKSRLYLPNSLSVTGSVHFRATKDLAAALGADIKITENSLEITGKPLLRGGACTSYGNSTMALCASLASLKCEGKILLNNAEAVNSVYPAFYKDFRHLGAELYAQL